MKPANIFAWMLILGAAWGVAEIFGKELLAELGLGGETIWLAAWAVLLLSIARGIWNTLGSSFLLGIVAAAFKFIGPSPNACHLMGIVSLGIVFDLFASSFLTQGRTQAWRCALVGVLTAFGARAFFVATSVYIAHFSRWVEGGWEMAVDHVVRGGGMVALAALVLVPVGMKIGEKVAGVWSESPTEDSLATVRR